jgi:DNA-binding transcriptional LysR family regulator
MPLAPWTPDLPALDLLVSVAELGSVGQAARAHHISQPTGSARLARLERQCGIALLVRGARCSTLTPAGEAVVAWARRVVESTRVLTDGVLALRADCGARLRIAASLTVAEYLMPVWLLDLRRANPGLDVAVTVENSHDVCDRVRAGEADVGFIESPVVPADLSVEAIGADRLALVVAPDYPLAARARDGVRPRELLDQPVLLREPGSGTRDTFMAALGTALGDHDPQLPYATELGSTTTIVATARAGGGIGVVSRRAVAGDIADGRLVELAIPELSLSRRLHGVWLGRRPTGLAFELIHLATKHCGVGHRPG